MVFTPPAQAASKPLPRILCLHGGGVSAYIFQIQTIRLQRALRDHFSFHFIDANFPAEPGPGVLPFFEGCGPYYKWVGSDLYAGGTGDCTEEALESTIDALEEREKDQEPFAGVLGFSQGGRVATGLMLDQQQQQRDPNRRKRKITGALKFGVLTCPSYPPICPPETELNAAKIEIPTVHLHGLSDPWLPQSRMLLENHYDKEKATVVTFEGEHHLPVRPADTEKLAKAILKAWNGVDGSEESEDYEIP